MQQNTKATPQQIRAALYNTVLPDVQASNRWVRDGMHIEAVADAVREVYPEATDGIVRRALKAMEEVGSADWFPGFDPRDGRSWVRITPETPELRCALRAKGLAEEEAREAAVAERLAFVERVSEEHGVHVRVTRLGLVAMSATDLAALVARIPTQKTS